jgi:membrane-bound lytic murein transglycosylase B
MGTSYATATINADRGMKSFKLSLDEFLVKRGANAIVSRGRALKQTHAALFASIEQRYGVPPGPLLAIWGMETAFGSQRGNQNMLSAVATLAYDCRRSEYFTDQLYAALTLIERGTLTPARAVRCTANTVRPSSCRRASCSTARAISTARQAR